MSEGAAKRACLLAFDIGGTKVVVARVNICDGRAEFALVRRAATPTNAQESRAMIWKLADEVTDGAIIDAAGVSFGGPIDPKRGVVLASLHVPGWADYPLAAAVADRYRVPCAVLNDGNAGALGEQRWGGGQGLADVLYVTVSTGVGAGLVLGGGLHCGSHGLAGEFGHLPLVDDGPVCSCGRRGCLESLASGLSIAREAREALERQPKRGAKMREVAGEDLAGLDARLVALAASRGDELALEVLARAGHALGTGLAIAALLCDPAVVVLGGSVVKSGEPLLGPARDVLKQRAFGEPPDIRITELAPEAPLYGAAAAALDLLTNRGYRPIESEQSGVWSGAAGSGVAIPV